jgi:hypothetical protein
MYRYYPGLTIYRYDNILYQCVPYSYVVYVADAS